MNMKLFSILSIFLITVSIACAQDADEQAIEFIPRETILQDAEIFDVKLSLSGDKVYYRKRGKGKQVFMLDAEKDAREKSVTFSDVIKTVHPSYLGGIVVVTQSSQGEKIYLTRNSKPKDITPFVAEEIRVIDFSAKLNTKVAVEISSSDNKKQGAWLVDLLGGKPRRAGILGDFDEWYFDDLFRVRAGKKRNDDGGVTLMHKLNGKWAEIQSYPADVGRYIGDYQGIVSVSGDGNTIWFTDNYESDKAVLMSIDSTNVKKEVAVDELTDLLPSTALLDEKGQPQMILGIYADARRKYLDSKVEKDMLWLEKELRGSPSVSQQSQNGQIWLVKEFTGGPLKYYLFDRKAQALRPLFSDTPKLDNYKFAERTAFSVGTRDAKKLPVHVYLPAGSDNDGDGYPDEALPTVLFVHGGPWKGVTHWNSWALIKHFQLLTDRGYAVINTEFRGSGGLGKEFTDAGNMQWGGKMRLDLEDISRWAQKKGIAAKNKTALWGYSYGGYAAMAAAGMSSDEFACYISMSGVSDLLTYIEDRQNSSLWTKRVGDPSKEEGRAILKKHSPINYVDKVNAPVLLVAGSQDDRVPQSQSDNYAEMLDAAGKEVIYFYYPEEGHHFTQLNTWISFWAIAEQLLARELEGKAAPVGEDREKGFFDAMYGADFIDGLE